MARELISHPFLPDKCPDLDVLADHFLAPRPVAQNQFIQQRLIQRARRARLQNRRLHLAASPRSQLRHQPVIRGLRRVRNKTKNGVRPIVADGSANLVGQSPAQRLPLAVNVHIVAARKIDALEGTGRPWQRRRERFRADRSPALDHDHVAGSHFLDLLHREIEHRHQRRPLRGKRDHFVILKIERRPNARRVSRHESIAVADLTAKRVAAVPLLRRPPDHARHVEVLADAPREFLAREIPRAQEPIDVLVLLIEVESDFFQNRLRIRGVDRVLTHRGERLVELGRIGQIKIPAQRQVARRPRRAPKKRVTRAEAVAAAGAVAQMPHQRLAPKIEMLFHRVGEFRVDHAALEPLVILAEQRLENLVERIALHAPLTKHEGLAGRHVQLHARHAGAVLSAVVLFLHQEKQLGKTPQRRPVFFLIKTERLQQSHQCDSAFVSDRVTHTAAPASCPTIAPVSVWFLSKNCGSRLIKAVISKASRISSTAF